jgi:hypothetical protein
MSNSANSGKHTCRNETSTMASSPAGLIGRSGNVGDSRRMKLVGSILPSSPFYWTGKKMRSPDGAWAIAEPVLGLKRQLSVSRMGC